jgi:hypothetical protein
MANWDTLKMAVASVVNTNGMQAITGQNLQDVLNSIISNVGENATFAGIASLDTNPGSPDGSVFYIATDSGTYTSFGGLKVKAGEAVVLLWKDGSWEKIPTGLTVKDKFSQWTIAGTTELAPHGWGDHISFNEIERDVLGDLMPIYEVKINSVSPSGNMIGFTRPNMFSPSDLGNRLNFHILLYSPIETVIYVNEYPNFADFIEDIDGKVKIKEGWNEIVFSEIVEAIATGKKPEVDIRDNEEFIGKTIYAKCIYYKGEKRRFLPNLEKTFMKKEEGKEPVEVELINKLRSLSVSESQRNIITDMNIYEVSGLTIGAIFENEDGIIKYRKDAGTGKDEGSYYYIDFTLDEGFTWKKNHEYYVALDVFMKEDSNNTAGLCWLETIPKYRNPQSIGNFKKKETTPLGERGLYKTIITVDSRVDEYPNSNILFVQTGGKYYKDASFDLTIYKIVILDLGEVGTADYMTWDSIDSLVNRLGLLDNYSTKIKEAETSDFAKQLVLKDIELWGDSLTAQNYGKYLAEITGRNCTTKGYGGKTSTYIRERFLSESVPSKTQVLWVGRNNYSQKDVVIDDIKDMVAHIGHSDFIVMCPPNGNYGSFGQNGNDGGGEMKGGGGYADFIELETRLSEEYPSNFLNIRKAVIQGWRMGNVKLLTSFIQPSIGGSVTINVSDADFLTAYNENDLTKFGDSIVKKIRIGLNGKYDAYDVVEYIDPTHLVVRLSEVNNKQPGTTIENTTDTGGNNDVIYLRVMQNMDYLCWLYDTTPSTFRSDGIHMTQDGLKLVAEIVARKLNSMKI